uniref:Reverse transcriptase domain-containing protein n=2 Tax=Trichogramma kaykai TaxID=54128 RepID=A0ABD2X054_9HYME
MDDECLLGADFYRTFNAIVHPRENLLQIEGASERVALEAVTSGKSSRICSLQIGLTEVTELQREELRQLVDRILPTGEAPIGCTSWAEHRIIVDESQRPVKQRYYPVSKKLEEDMHSQVRELLAAGHIRRSSSEWSSPVVMVRKANGSYRLCIDYRKLNAVTKVSAYPIPNMDIILRKLQNARYITTLDLSAAFHQVPMSCGSEKYTAFTVPGMGLFEWTRMPYGVAGGPATFQELADKIIGPEMEPVAFAYIDDIIIATATYAEHLRWLEHVLKRINQAGLTINRDKSFFCRSEVKYLGVIVDRNGFRPDPDKIAPVTGMTAPKTLKQLRRFLGIASWYRKFLENFATIADPLNKLLKKNTKYI